MVHLKVLSEILVSLLNSKGEHSSVDAGCFAQENSKHHRKRQYLVIVCQLCTVTVTEVTVDNVYMKN